jgi:[ribosomal protein S5]-alanine N-acetyltransferase
MAVSPQNGTTDFIIIDRSSSRTIGKIGVWQSSEIGFLLARKYWGKGLAKEALLAILRYLFVDRAFEEITADVDPRNERSIRLLEDVGFVKTGFRKKTFEIGGEWVDSVDLGLLGEDFVKKYVQEEELSK